MNRITSKFFALHWKFDFQTAQILPKICVHCNENAAEFEIPMLKNFCENFSLLACIVLSLAFLLGCVAIDNSQQKIINTTNSMSNTTASATSITTSTSSSTTTSMNSTNASSTTGGTGDGTTPTNSTTSISQTDTTGGTITNTNKQTERIYPSDIVYVGAFTLPDGNGVASWQYGGSAAAYYPNGDPNGPADGYPGSIFATGHEWEQQVSEISIPAPVNSGDIAMLPTATTLQAFHDVKGNSIGELEIPRAGLAYLPAQDGQTSGKIYCCWGQHMQDQDYGASHCWFNTDLANPQFQGMWRIKDQPKYVTNDYLFEIPEGWATQNTPNLRLATGRYRDGGQGAYGPSIIAIGPWNSGNPPAADTELDDTPLLLYSNAYDDPEEAHAMANYSHADQWGGGAWLTKDNRSAVVFVGYKALGNTWYGFPDGTVWPEEPPYPPVQENAERGWWSERFTARMLFYDPNDLAEVASGNMEPYEPQPYATLDFNDVLFDPPPASTSSMTAHKQMGDIAYDREHGIIYVFEMLGDKDNEKPIVHVWKIR